ncbi:hypothetical protein ACOMHN_058086 [Nucella lapillus]
MDTTYFVELLDTLLSEGRTHSSSHHLSSYQGQWSCISMLKGDGTPGGSHLAVAHNAVSAAMPMTPLHDLASGDSTSTDTSTVKFYKGKMINETSQVVWH